MRTAARRTLELLLLLLLAGPCWAQERDYPYPERVRVLPVFFVPTDQKPPTPREVKALQRHVIWAQRRFERLLAGRDTFELARKQPDVYRARFGLNVYRSLSDDAAQYVSELLAHYGFNRFTCPFVLLVVLVNPTENAPAGGGRPCNGGFNRGSGVVILSSYGLTRPTPFQSTLRHELGHSFGLPHVDVYGYSMSRNPSIMSYNTAHHTSGFRPSNSPGSLIPEDVRVLSLNDRVFAKLAFDHRRDLPDGYRPKTPIELGPMTIPDEARFVPQLAERRAAGVGFELKRGGARVRQEPSWNRAQVRAHLRELRERDPQADVAAFHEGAPVFLARRYELFYGAKRVGVEETWTRAQGLKNLRWNLETKPQVRPVGRYDGIQLLWAPKQGYELFHSGVRVGHVKEWTREEALENFRWNLSQNSKRVAVTARFNGVPLAEK